MRRVLAGLVPALLVAAGEASASSILAIDGGPGATPSIIARGTPEAQPVEARMITVEETDGPAVVVATEMFSVSPSIIAYGEDAIPAREEQVAEQPSLGEWYAQALPLVIRGGLPDEAVAEPAEEAPDGTIR